MGYDNLWVALCIVEHEAYCFVIMVIEACNLFIFVGLSSLFIVVIEVDCESMACTCPNDSNCLEQWAFDGSILVYASSFFIYFFLELVIKERKVFHNFSRE